MNKFLDEALKEAKKAYKKLEVPVGAVIVRNGKIVAKAHNLRETKKLSTAHAEILCIERACKKLKSWRLEDCTLYVTLEPCAMCSGAIMQSRIKKVVYGAKDLKNGCVESVCKLLDEKTTWKTEYEYIEEKNCSEILSEFFKKLRLTKKDKDNSKK